MESLKTNKELLMELSEKDSGKAIYNTLNCWVEPGEGPKKFLKEIPKHQKVSETLLAAFPWRNSIEGHDYWNEKHINLQSYENGNI